MFESCSEIQSHFSDYVDGRCDFEARRSLRYHLSVCPKCRRELDLLRAAQSDLNGLPEKTVPGEVIVRLHVALSQHLHQNLLGRIGVYLENALKPLLLPASAGVFTAIICFGLILGSQVIPAAGVPDEPVAISTPPRVRALGPLNFFAGDKDVVLVTHVDDVGRVTYYQILSGQHSPALVQRLDRLMYFSNFQPATSYGRPTEGQVVLCLHRITVRG